MLLRRDAPDTAAALELARSAARGDWLLRMDADDRCPPDRLRYLLGATDRARVVASQVAALPGGRERYLSWQMLLLH